MAFRDFAGFQDIFLADLKYFKNMFNKILYEYFSIY